MVASSSLAPGARHSDFREEGSVPHVHAVFTTSLGEFTVRLLPEHAPQTVANFIELATGARQWKDPRDGQSKNAPLYDDTVFHRVIDGFMIQGGDPEGTGRGGPGYQFEDEFGPG